jgi:hypothetical protein
MLSFGQKVAYQYRYVRWFINIREKFDLNRDATFSLNFQINNATKKRNFI